MKINTILVPIDFTPISRNTIKYAAKLAENSSIQIVCLHVFVTQVPSIPTGILQPPVASGNLMLERKRSEESLTSFLDEIPEITSRNIKTVLTPGPGITEDIICESAKDNKADLIILGTKPSSYFERLFVGTLEEKVSRKAPCSVMMIPEGLKTFQLKSVSLLVDQIGLDNQLQTELVNEIIQKFNAFLYIIHVAKEDDPGFTKKDLIKGYLPKIKKKVFSVHIFKDDDPHEAIEKFIYEKPVDLSILLYQEHNYLERIFQPGLRKKLAIKPDVPLLVLK